jgi:TonB-linked SusC/RagA family outer membrane protein
MTFRCYAVVSSALLAASALAGSEAQAQASTGTITGRLVDATSQQPIAGARVTVAGTSVGTTSRDDGRFVLTAVPTGARTIRLARIGFSPKDSTISVSAGMPVAVTFALRATVTSLSDVVVVGYGTARREDLTGSIASVQSEELAKTTVNTLEQGLQGRVAGVQVTQSDAAPGGSVRVQIRGTNSMNAGSAQPLYVIDGVPVSSSGGSKMQGNLSEGNLQSLTETNPLATIAPEDIESIDILKDASSTAIYGSRGANGVVMITTKKGRRNSSGVYTFNIARGYSSVVREVPVLNAFDFATYVNKAYTNAFGATTQYPYGGRPGSSTPDSIRKLVGEGTNWQSAIFQTAPVTDGQLGFSGGDERGSYNVSSNLLQQQGVINGSQFRRGGLRVNLDRDVTKSFRLSTNVAATRSINNMVRSSTINGYNAIGIVREAVTYIPFTFRDTTKTDPRFEDANTLSVYGSNPLRYTDEVHEADVSTRGIGGLRGVLQLGHGFAFDQNFGANYERRAYNAYFPSTVNEGRNSKGNAQASGSEYGNLLTESLLRYNGSLGDKQTIEAVGGWTFQHDFSSWNSQEVQGFPNDILGGNVLQNGGTPMLPYSGQNSPKLASFLGRVNYSLFDRYLFTATVRRDGSSNFAANNKWATFPAFAVAWKAIDEPMLSGQHLLSDLKFRASVGKSGNQAISPYQSLAAISGVPMTLNEVVVPAYVYTQLPNPNLRWETTRQFDGGIDVGAFQNRLTLTADVYRKNTYDLLQQITVAQNSGFSDAWINAGNVTNKGVEFALGYDVLRAHKKDGFSWNVNANASHNRNRIMSLGGAFDQQFAGNLGAGGNLEVKPFIQKVGESIGAMYGYRTLGLIRTAEDSVNYAKQFTGLFKVGDVRYSDLDGDGKITSADQTIIGDANPTWTWGLSNTFRFGNFDASALVTAIRGNSVINAERMRYLNLDGTINVPREFIENSFDPTTNPNGKYPIIRQDRKSDARFSDIYIEDGSFVRLKNVQVGYNFGLPRARTARLYVNAVNLYTWTKYTGFDPEVSAFGGSQRPGVDLGSYPQSRVFTFGVNTTF